MQNRNFNKKPETHCNLLNLMFTPINDWVLKTWIFLYGIAPYGHPTHLISILGSLSQVMRNKFREIL
jgi:hypothetical protein